MTRDPDRLEPSADPIVDLILYLVADRAPGKSIGPDAVARAFAAEGAKAGDPPNAWRRYGRPVRLPDINTPEGQTLTQLSAKLRAAIADFEPAWSRGAISYAGGGIESHVFKLQLLTGDAIAFKVPMVRYIENDNDQGLDAFDLLRQEQSITSYLSRHGFPVPVPIALSVPQSKDRIGFLASQYIESDGSAPDSGALGHLLLRLHQVPPPSFRPVAQRLETWEESIAFHIRNRSEVIETLSAISFPPTAPAQLTDILRSKQQKIALLHMDFRLENILCLAGRVKAVVDWSNSLVGPPDLELYRVAEYGLWNDAVQKQYGAGIEAEQEGDPLSLVYRLYTATMLAVVFLSEAPDPVRAKIQVARVQELYDILERLLGG